MQTNVCCCYNSFAVSGYSFLMKKLPFHTAVAVLKIFGRNELGSFRSADPIVIARCYFRDFEVLITNVSKVWVDSHNSRGITQYTSTKNCQRSDKYEFLLAGRQNLKLIIFCNNNRKWEYLNLLRRKEKNMTFNCPLVTRKISILNILKWNQLKAVLDF